MELKNKKCITYLLYLKIFLQKFNKLIINSKNNSQINYIFTSNFTILFL